MSATLSKNILFSHFLDIAKQFPSKTALIDAVNNDSLTYQELLKAVETKSAEYKNCEEKPVILCEQNSIDWVVQFLALQLAGAIVVPVHVHLSEAEKNIIYSKFEEAFLNTPPPLSPSPQRGKGEDFLFGASLTAFARPQTPDILEIDSNSYQLKNVAAIFHTSGTTGQPKGVMLSAENIVFDVKANCEILELTPDDVLVTMSPFSHVYGLVNVLLSTLFTGASLVIIPGFQPRKIIDAIEQHRVSVLIGVPTMYHSLLSVFESHPKSISSLRICHSGAAPMSVALFHQLENTFKVPVQEGYGLSEATSIVTSNPLHGPRKPGSIGLPLKGIETQLDENSQLLIKGPTVMQGYYQNCKREQDAWLATGDIVTQDADGYYYWQGRMDDVINVAGEKVYPKEVEEVLYQHADVALCAVKAQTCPVRFQRVSAFVVKKPEIKTSDEDFTKQLMTLCRTQLASYKVPYVIQIVATIPTTPSGKIKRSLL